MSRTVVFLGNCQLGVLAYMYEQVCAPFGQDQEVVYIPSYQPPSEEQRGTIARADILVNQVLDFAPEIGEIETKATVHLVPLISAAFLWPCTGHAHPQNAPHPYGDPSGPYAGELGDSFLNRMIRDGVDPEEAVTRYVSADIAALRNVDRMREIMMDSQRKRDLICGYEFAEYIDAHFKNCKIFRSPNHPTETLTLLFATEVFKRLGLEDGILGRLELVPKAALFPPTEMPIHPSIIAHFGLSYVDIDTRYRFFDEGSFTFAEYAARYMRYEWNPLLGEGYSLVKQRELAAAVEVLRRAVKLSPRSAAGYSVLSGVLHELGRLEEARACANIAVRIEPDNPHYVAVAAHFQTELAT